MAIFIPLPYNETVYSKTEVDNFLILKADKVPTANHLDIAGLRGTDGNLISLGVKLSDLEYPDFADGGKFDDTGEL